MIPLQRKESVVKSTLKMAAMIDRLQEYRNSNYSNPNIENGDTSLPQNFFPSKKFKF